MDDISSLPCGELKIHNVLASAQLECDRKIDLCSVAQRLQNAYFDPDEFPAVRTEVKGLMTGSTYVVALFETGRIQTTGGCIPREAGFAMKQVAKWLRDKCGYVVTLRRFQVQNILAVADIGHTVSLTKLQQLYPGKLDYEPDRFPAAHIRVAVPPEDKEGLDQTDSQKVQKSVAAKRAAARITKPKKEEVVTANVFGNGKINFIGGKSVRSIARVIEELRPYFDAAS